MKLVGRGSRWRRHGGQKMATIAKLFNLAIEHNSRIKLINHRHDCSYNIVTSNCPYSNISWSYFLMLWNSCAMSHHLAPSKLPLIPIGLLCIAKKNTMCGVFEGIIVTYLCRIVHRRWGILGLLKREGMMKKKRRHYILKRCVTKKPDIVFFFNALVRICRAIESSWAKKMPPWSQNHIPTSESKKQWLGSIRRVLKGTEI